MGRWKGAWHTAAPVNAIKKAQSLFVLLEMEGKAALQRVKFCVRCRQSEHEQRSTCFVGAREACEQHALLLSLLPRRKTSPNPWPRLVREAHACGRES